jgi:antitoxin component of RelBE/YafQ-DinJ toxin-antitoxin module
MSTTKTVSTRIDNNVHTLFTDYCNQQGKTMSQMLNQFVNDIVSQNKDLIDSSQCSIESDEETESKELTKFSQDKPLEETLKSLQNKNNQELAKQALKSIISDMVSDVELSIESLKRKVDQKREEDRMKKQMACFDNDSCFN